MKKINICGDTLTEPINLTAGDSIQAVGHCWTIGKVLNQVFYSGYTYQSGKTRPDDFDIEFIDTNGGYHHFESWHDGPATVTINH